MGVRPFLKKKAWFPSMEFVGDAWQHFRHEIVKMGALGECWVEDVVTSPSCQIYITPDGHIEVISTHEQAKDEAMVAQFQAVRAAALAQGREPDRHELVAAAVGPHAHANIMVCAARLSYTSRPP